MMKKSSFLTVVLVIFLTAICSVAAGDASRKPGETERLSWGGDIRARATQIHPNTFFPDGQFSSDSSVQWLRFRKRLWLGYQFTEDVKLDVRLANRWHYVRRHFLPDDHPAYNPWEFPDEIIFDQLKITWNQVADLPLNLTIGRQDAIFGTGMIVLEGTAYDQGRGIYFDGARATWRQADTTMDLFGFYSREQDDFLIINDRDRVLRRGDTLLSGLYWTQNFSPEINTDAYYMFHNIINDSVIGDDVRQHIIGGRLFGNPHQLIDYSAELAIQEGKLRQSDRNMKGMMSDLRLGVLLPGDLPFIPRVNLQHTWMRGDDRTRETYTGWHPVAAEYPIWREELMPIATRGNWTNLNQSRIEGVLQLHEQLTWTGALAYLRADTVAGYEDSFGEPRGKTIGQLYSSFLDFIVNPSLTLRLEGAALRPGNYYADDQTAHWVRLEGYFRF